MANRLQLRGVVAELFIESQKHLSRIRLVTGLEVSCDICFVPRVHKIILRPVCHLVDVETQIIKRGSEKQVVRLSEHGHTS